MESETSPHWRGWGQFSLIFGSVYIAASLLMTLWSGTKIRPLLLMGQMIWVLAIVGLMTRRRFLKETKTSYRWYRFSLVELFVIVTGLTVFLGLSSADHNRRLRIHRDQQQLQDAAASILGPDGQLGFESDETLTIGVCDRSSDDQRFFDLANLIDDYAASNGVSRVVFGTGRLTAGTPPNWPGITDASAYSLLQWEDLRELSVQGTAITIERRRELLSLPALDERSRSNLAAE